ncbi:MAG: hypothetical protein IKS22_03985 [Bacteroidales bacterium]|nr:hypothetical protein [Bacteroidales bacterium]
MTLFWRFAFETGDKMRMRKHPLDTSDLDILSDIPYIDDGSPCPYTVPRGLLPISPSS